MATLQPSVKWPEGVAQFSWDDLGQGDDGGYVTWLQCADRSVQVAGTFGGAVLIIEGSNDGTNWATLTDPQGNALSISTAKIEQVMEACLYVRPRVSGGDGTTSLYVCIVGRMS